MSDDIIHFDCKCGAIITHDFRNGTEAVCPSCGDRSSIVRISEEMRFTAIKQHLAGRFSNRQLAALVAEPAQPGESWKDVAIRSGVSFKPEAREELQTWSQGIAEDSFRTTLANILVLRLGGPDEVGRQLADPTRTNFYEFDLLGLRLFPIPLTSSLRDLLLRFDHVRTACNRVKNRPGAAQRRRRKGS